MAKCSPYGFSGAFAAITAAAAWILLKMKADDCYRNYGDLIPFHLVCIVAGIIICIGSLFDIASALRKMHQIVNLLGVVAIAAVGCLAIYCAYIEFKLPCVPTGGILKFDIGSIDSSRNIFSAEDGMMIGVFILDIVAGLLFFSSAANFSM